MSRQLSFLVTLLAFLFALSGCQQGNGTGTPNPGLNTEAPTAPDQNNTNPNYIEKSYLALSDTNTKSSFPEQTKGDSDKIDVWSTQSEEKTGYIKFDLSKIPVTSQIEKAVIRFYFYDIRAGGKLDFYSVRGEWDETSLNFNNSFDLRLDYQSSFKFEKYQEDGFVDVDVTALVKKWVNGTLKNDGLAIAGSQNGEVVQVEFSSKEDTSRPTQLIVNYFEH